MGERLNSGTIYLTSSVLGILGLSLISASVYIAVTSEVSFTLGIFSTIGLALIIFSALIISYFKLNKSEIVIRNKRYAIGRKNSEDLFEKISEVVSEEIRDIEQEVLGNNREKRLEQEDGVKASRYNIDFLQFTIDELSKQIAVKKYENNKESKEGLRIVEYTNNNIIAASETELELTEGLLFNVFVEDGSVSEHVATAKLTQAQSTSGTIYEFEISDWKFESGERVGRAQEKLKSGNGRLKIISEGIVDTGIDELVETRENITKMKNKRDIEYET